MSVDSINGISYYLNKPSVIMLSLVLCNCIFFSQYVLTLIMLLPLYFDFILSHVLTRVNDQYCAYVPLRNYFHSLQ